MTKLNWDRCRDDRRKTVPSSQRGVVSRRRRKKPKRWLRTDDGTAAEAWLYGAREPETVPDTEP